MALNFNAFSNWFIMLSDLVSHITSKGSYDFHNSSVHHLKLDSCRLGSIEKGTPGFPISIADGKSLFST
jgi:hypothetical protein